MKKNEVQSVLVKRVTNANLRGSGYVIPESLNSIWRKTAEGLVEKGKFTITKSRSKANGYHVVGLEVPAEGTKLTVRKSAPKKKVAKTEATPAPEVSAKPKRSRSKKTVSEPQIVEPATESVSDEVEPSLG